MIFLFQKIWQILKHHANISEECHDLKEKNVLMQENVSVCNLTFAFDKGEEQLY